MREFHISASTTDWLVQGTQPFTAAQISSAELAASTTQLSVESKNDQPTSSAVIGWATIFGIVIALGVLGMSVGLVRSETASDLRTLAATGASSYTRRTLTAVTAGALGFLGALLGVLGGYIGMIGWLRSNSLNGGIAALGNVPVADLLLILLGMPAVRGDRRVALRRASSLPALPGSRWNNRLFRPTRCGSGHSRRAGRRRIHPASNVGAPGEQGRMTDSPRGA